MTNLHLSPERVAECGLKPDSLNLIEQARISGTISLARIYETLRPGIRGSDMMKPSMIKLIMLLDSLKVSINYNGSANRVKKVQTAEHPPSRDKRPIAIVDNTEDESKSESKTNKDMVLDLYLNQLGQVELLTAEEEISLAKRIQRGDAVAREHMIKANLRLVVKIALDYNGCGLPLLDLINEGNIGLMKGVERFDPRKGNRFSTYGSWWIKQTIKRALSNDSRTIRLPVHMAEKANSISKAERKLYDELGREPDEQELADELGICLKKLRGIRSAIATAPTSLEAQIGEDGDGEAQTYSEVTADDNAALPSIELDNKERRGILLKALPRLDEREQAILAYRFGLNGTEERTLEEIGKN